MMRQLASVARLSVRPASVRLVSASAARQARLPTATPLATALSVQNEKFSVRNYSAKAPLTKKTLEERIILVLSLYDKIDPKKLTMDSDFAKDLGLDSLDHVEMVMAMEEEFGFEIPDGDADMFKTPRHIWQYICDKEDVFE